MKSEFVITRQGKSFALYAGLLDEAHQRGLTGILTQLVQVPSAENGQTAIVTALATLDGKTFSGIGDANPDNVARAMVPHLIRLAETRAKARALRDAINVAMCSLEELGDDEPVAAPAPIPARAGLPADVATPAQVRALYLLGRELGLTDADVDRRATLEHGAPPYGLSKRQASTMIDALKAGKVPAGAR